MTTLTINIEEGHEEDVKAFLRNAGFKTEIVEENRQALVAEPETPYEKIKKLLDDAKGKDLFKEIEDPSAWQREIRKEWDRDL